MVGGNSIFPRFFLNFSSIFRQFLYLPPTGFHHKYHPENHWWSTVPNKDIQSVSKHRWSTVKNYYRKSRGKPWVSIEMPKFKFKKNWKLTLHHQTEFHRRICGRVDCSPTIRTGIGLIEICNDQLLAEVFFRKVHSFVHKLSILSWPCHFGSRTGKKCVFCLFFLCNWKNMT